MKPLCDGGGIRHRRGLDASAPAQAADVVSSNIVGYEKVSLSKGLNMVGVQFQAVGGDSLVMSSVGTLDNTMAGFDDDEMFATTLLVWTGNGYKTYGWSGTSGTDVYEDSSYDKQWLDSMTREPSETPTDKGLGCWIKAGKAGTFTISGEVPTDETAEATLSSGLNMLAYPWPGEIEISKCGILDGSFAGFDEDEMFATTLLVWTGNGYKTYGWSGTSGTDVYEDSSYDNQWLDSITMEPATAKISYGQGMWIKAANGGKITFTSPLAQ